MKTEIGINEWIRAIQLSTHLHRGHFFDAVESPGWSKRYERGGIRFNMKCLLCGEIVKHDIREPEIGDTDWKEIYVPHLTTVHEPRYRKYDLSQGVTNISGVSVSDK